LDHLIVFSEVNLRRVLSAYVKARLAAIRHLFDWLVVGQVVPVNPAASVRGPRHVVNESKTPVLSPDEARQLLDSIDTSTPVGLRDRALIALMVYSFARVGAAIVTKDVVVKNRRLWIRLHGKGGKQHQMPCHHNLEGYLHEYLEQTGLASEPKHALFPTIERAGRGRGAGRLSPTPLPQRGALSRVTADGIDAHDRALNGQQIEQLGDRDEFVGHLCHFDLPSTRRWRAERLEHIFP
jgi:site-specific recombinase XerC